MEEVIEVRLLPASLSFVLKESQYNSGETFQNISGSAIPHHRSLIPAPMRDVSISCDRLDSGCGADYAPQPRVA